ncbi:MAG TPA: sensor histidine kinase [Gemmatimonadaceae bacterium]|nr:sensor histidine kinase [Gemmatimonadaceae bacterium]
MPTDPSQYPFELAAILSDRLRTAKQALVTQWLERITARVSIESRRIFPTHELLNHIPLLIEGVAGYLKRPERDIDSKAPVVAKAMELGALRHEQGFDAYEILKEYEMLEEIVFAFLRESADRISGDYLRRDFLVCWERIGQAMELIRQATVGHFLRLSAAQINQRENRLRRFNRTVAHELKNNITAIVAASTALSEAWVAPSERKEFEEIIARNADGLQHVLANLESLSRTQGDSRSGRHVMLPEAASEAVRELEEAAKAKGVNVRVADDMPPIEVDAAVVELCLMNYLSNGIKYSDTAKTERWVSVEARIEGPDPEHDREVVIRVSDNGIGIPADKRERLFQEFYRAHGETVTEAEGTGLGLSIVRETVESIGGRAWAEFPEDAGSVFAFAIPSRRNDDVEATKASSDTVEETAASLSSQEAQSG